MSTSDDATEVYNQVTNKINLSGFCKPSGALLGSALITWGSKDASRGILFKPYITDELHPVRGVSYVLVEKGKPLASAWLSGPQMDADSIAKMFLEWIVLGKLQ